MNEFATDSTDEQTRFWEKISLITRIASICRGNALRECSIDEVLVRIQEMVPFEAATLYLYDNDAGKSSISASLGSAITVSGRFLTLHEMEVTKGENRERLPILISDPAKVTECSPGTDLAELIAAPLVVEEQIVGLLIVGSFDRRVFHPKHIRLMSVVADQLAISIERQIYERKIDKKNNELEIAHQALQKAQQEMVESETLSAVASLASTINHEINNPLTSILGNAQFLRLKKNMDVSKIDERLERIEKAALRIADINKKLLRIDSIVSQSHPGISNEQMLDLGKSASESSQKEK